LSKVKIVVVGGGTGTSVVARALKQIPDYEVTLCVTTFDSGGSAGAALDEHGALPSSDAIQGILALMPEGDEESVRKLGTLRAMLSYRFEEDPVVGKRLGNYMMIPLERLYGFDEAIRRMCELFETDGQVIPVATVKGTLVAHYANGEEVYGEAKIDSPESAWQKLYEITSLWVEPEVTINPRAYQALREADKVVFGPGDLFTSILPNVVVSGFVDALSPTVGLVYLGNLVNKAGQTSNFTASKYVQVLESYLGRAISRILLPDDLDQIPQAVLTRYSLEEAYPVRDDLMGDPRVIRRHLVSQQIQKQSPNDQVRRSLLRHDPDLLAKALPSVLTDWS
jgi:uncharacterized cofD-like protein